MQKRALQNRWQTEIWETVEVLAPHEGEDRPRALPAQDGVSRWLHPGLKLQLYRDEAEGYYLNITTAEPRIFVMWRIEDDQAVPRFVTASYHEASGWMDSGEHVDSVPMAPVVEAWVAEFVRDNYRPEPKKKRIKPQSFKNPADRAKS